MMRRHLLFAKQSLELAQGHKHETSKEYRTHFTALMVNRTSSLTITQHRCPLHFTPVISQV